MKSLERIGEFIKCRRMNREALKLQQEWHEAWEQYHRDTAGIHERFLEWQSRKLIEAHLRRQAALPEDQDRHPGWLTMDDWLRERPEIVKPKEPEKLVIVWM